jgi:hypothetical protein
MNVKQIGPWEYYSYESMALQKGPPLESNSLVGSSVAIYRGDALRLTVSGEGRPRRHRRSGAEHPHHEAHLTVPLAWPEAARGDPTTCAGG